MSGISLFFVPITRAPSLNDRYTTDYRQRLHSPVYGVYYAHYCQYGNWDAQQPKDPCEPSRGVRYIGAPINIAHLDDRRENHTKN